MAETSHAIMKSSLAKALIEAGVQHHDLGGFIGDVVNPILNLGKGATVTSPYQATLAPTQTSNYGDTITQAQQNAMTVNPLQQSLASQLLAQSQGAGPNPAQSILNQNTGANIAGQAALAAGQRGAGANTGLITRQVGQQGGQIQQNAVGQAATLNAQQQLQSEQQLQQLYATQGQQANQLLATAAGAQNGQNNSMVQNYGQEQGINAKTAAENAAAQNKTAGGLLNGIGGALPAVGSALWKGAGSLWNGAGAAGTWAGAEAGAGGTAVVGGAADAAPVIGGAAIDASPVLLAAEGGKVEQSGDIVSPKGPAPILPLANGGGVPGKAPHPGNDVRNDTELSLLSKGEVVLPNSVTQSADPAKKAAEFIAHLKGEKEKKSGKKEPASYEKVAGAKKSLKERVEHLERLCGGGRVYGAAS